MKTCQTKTSVSKLSIDKICYLILFVCLTAGCSKKELSNSSQKISDQRISDANGNADLGTTAAQIRTTMKLFDGGNEGNNGVIYHTFRIPSIIKTSNGTLVAFAEGRRVNDNDYGDINVVFKRSFNNGSSWTSLDQVVGNGPGTWGNPTAVYDWTVGTNGRIWLFMEWNDQYKQQWSDFDSWGDRRIHTSYSDDHGATWSTPLDRTSTLTPSTFKWDCVGPGIGIRTAYDSPGRLIIPAYKRNIYSDDHGATWQYQNMPTGTDESTIVELMDGTLMRNDRPGTSSWTASKTRRKSVGTISGGFSAWSNVTALPDPKCEGSMLRYNASLPNRRIIFLNPNGTGQRCNMTVRISYDDGVTWPKSRALFPISNCDYSSTIAPKGGYSSMVKTEDFCVGALIEMNENVSIENSHKSIDFHKFNLAWILNGSSEPN